jgi:DNA-binding winged helix-turn-helix (wHTH) protein
VTYQFGEFTLVGDARQLLVNGNEVHLSPKAFDLLTTLIAHRSRAVPKAELQERLWPSTFVEETNLPTLVAEIRRTLDDTAQHSRFIRTVHRFGYQFVGSVMELTAPETPAHTRVRPLLMHGSRQIVLMDGVNVIGRARDATIWLDSRGVSRHHARVTVRDREVTIEDLGSKNGTLVRGARIVGAHSLSEGDDIQLGLAVLTFQLDSPVGPTDTVSSRL